MLRVTFGRHQKYSTRPRVLRLLRSRSTSAKRVLRLCSTRTKRLLSLR
jgi:hypothetical protein